METVISDRISHLGRINTFLKQNQQLALKTRHQSRILHINRSLDHNSGLVEEAGGMYFLCSALGSLYSILNSLSLIHIPPRQFSKPRLRHELRMKPFISLSIPQAIAYEELDGRSTAALETPNDLMAGLLAVDNAVREAKKQFVSLQKREREDMKVVGIENSWNKRWVSPCMMACIVTGLAVATLQKAQRMHCQNNIKPLTDVLSVRLPEVELRYHEWWIVPTITEKSTARQQ